MFLHKWTKPKHRKDRVLLVNYFRKIETVNWDGKRYAYYCVPMLDCINVTLNVRCNHQNNQTTVSLLKTIPKLLLVYSETDIPKDLTTIVAEISRLIKGN